MLIINPKSNDAQGYKADDIICFQELLIARDAYWKIASEEMGLSKPWKPDLTDVKQDKYAITNMCNKIQYNLSCMVLIMEFLLSRQKKCVMFFMKISRI